jgi:hypothetical protein
MRCVPSGHSPTQLVDGVLLNGCRMLDGTGLIGSIPDAWSALTSMEYMYARCPCPVTLTTTRCGLVSLHPTHAALCLPPASLLVEKNNRAMHLRTAAAYLVLSISARHGSACVQTVLHNNNTLPAAE